MVNYAYNGDDQRVGQGSGGALTGELYVGASAGSPLLQNSDGTYTPGVSQHGTGGSAYFAADALGSTRGITGGTGTATGALLYDAFGETLTRSGSTATPVQFAGTSGYQADATNGLLLLGHRYYDPSIGRFLSSDPAQAGSNWYAYCDNNPLVHVDPTGLKRHSRGKGGGNKARRFFPRYRTKKRAYERAKKEGHGLEPVHHPHPERGWPHYHRGDGVNDGVHHSYPPRQRASLPVPDPRGGLVIGIGIGIWEAVKWGGAIVAAPETGGLSLAGAAFAF